MGNTTGNSQFNIDQEEDNEDRQQRNIGGRSNVLYHVFVNRGTNSTEIQREEVNVTRSMQATLQTAEPSREEEPQHDTSSNEDDYITEEDEHVVTLQFLSQLLGGGQNLRQRFHPTAAPPSPDPSVRPKPTPMDSKCDIYKEMIGYTRNCVCHSNMTTSNNIVEKTRAFQYRHDKMSNTEQINTTSQFLPKHSCIADAFETRLFCGNYSDDGNIFICAPQDGSISLYNTEGSKFSRFKVIDARDVGWSVLSTAFSPDQNWFIYSTWSPCIYMCNVHGTDDHHYTLDLHPDDEAHFCAFSTIFSPDNKEILAATSDGMLYVYNRDRSQRTLSVHTHQDDANGVAFADCSGQIVCTTGDDGLCKVWDIRCLNVQHPAPVGVFAGHKDGITFVDSKNDGRYLITNSKDQSIKLWDIRKFSPRIGIEATLDRVANQSWDYRWENPPNRTWHESGTKMDGDTSVMTYTGHSVKNTLIRCRFSPSFTTGQRYIYTGCANGRVIIYDVLTGEIVSKLQSHRSHFCVRDVSWNPYQVGTLVSSAWDGKLQIWSPEKRTDYVEPSCDMPLRFW